MTAETVIGILIPFLGTILGAAMALTRMIRLQLQSNVHPSHTEPVQSEQGTARIPSGSILFWEVRQGIKCG